MLKFHIPKMQRTHGSYGKRSDVPNAGVIMSQRRMPVVYH